MPGVLMTTSTQALSQDQRRELMRELSAAGVAARQAKRRQAVADKIAELIQNAPPLTDDQRRRLSALLVAP